jgi:hypothetical protein
MSTPAPNNPTGVSNSQTFSPNQSSSINHPPSTTPIVTSPSTNRQTELIETINLHEIKDPNLRELIKSRNSEDQAEFIKRAMKGYEAFKNEMEAKRLEEEKMKQEIIKKKEEMSNDFQHDPELKKIWDQGIKAIDEGKNPFETPGFALMTKCHRSFLKSEEEFNQMNQRIKSAKVENNQFYQTWKNDHDSRNQSRNTNNGPDNNYGNSSQPNGGVFVTDFWKMNVDY